jgi:hypothetical protein
MTLFTRRLLGWRRRALRAWTLDPTARNGESTGCRQRPKLSEVRIVMDSFVIRPTTGQFCASSVEIPLYATVTATAVDDSTPGVIPEPAAFRVAVRWRANGVDHTDLVTWDQPVKAGAPLMI